MNQNKNLYELSKEFFSRKYLYEEDLEPIRGRSGQKWHFDAMITINPESDIQSRFGVFIREWNRSIGVNQIRQLEKACRDTKCDGGVIIGDTFSSHAEIFGENLGIQILDRGTLLSKMKSGI